MERSSFFSAIISPDGIPDRAYNDEDFARYFASFIGNGVFPNPATNLQVKANNDMTITLKKGPAWINGYMYENTDDLIFNIDAADGVLSRVDRLVLRLDNAGREIRAEVKKGVFASSPVAPTLQRDADAYELALADVYIAKGITSITQSNITDLRLSTELCGIVHGVVEQVDTEVLFQDYLSWINQKKDEFNTNLINYKDLKQIEIDNIVQNFQDSFNTWFDSIRNILDENAAGNLLSMIDNLSIDLNNLRNDLDDFSITLPLNVSNYSSVSQWADILIPDEKRGKALLQLLLSDENSSLEIASSEQAMLVIMQEERFNKTRQVPFDYDQIIFKLGQNTEVGQYLAWVEELLSDSIGGIEKLELGLMLEGGSIEIASNKYAMNTIMAEESIDGLIDYRVKFASQSDFNNEVNKFNNEVERLDTRIDGMVV